MSAIGSTIGTVAILAASAELIAQGIDKNQVGLVDRVIKDNTNAQRITKGVIGGVAALSVLGIAFSVRNLNVLEKLKNN